MRPRGNWWRLFIHHGVRSPVVGMRATGVGNVATALVLAYDGSRGWAWDPGVKEAVRTAICTFHRKDVHIVAASRTDAGVHAQGQVVCVTSEEPLLGGDCGKVRHKLNQLLPEDAAVRLAVVVPGDFDVRGNMGKEYQYTLHTGASRDPLQRRWEWHVPSRRGARAFDVDAARAACRAFEGEHSFYAFENVGSEPRRKDSVCSISHCALESVAEDRLRLVVRGDRFLYRMVRNMAGTIVRCGLGEMDPQHVAGVLRTGLWGGHGFKLTAPAHGLVLVRVFFSVGPLSGDLDGWEPRSHGVNLA